MMAGAGHCIGYEPLKIGSPCDGYLPGGGHRQRVHRHLPFSPGIIGSFIQMRGEIFPIQFQSVSIEKPPAYGEG